MMNGADIIVDAPRVTHDTYLELADELGIPGLLAFLAIVIGSLSCALRAARLWERALRRSRLLGWRGVLLLGRGRVLLLLDLVEPLVLLGFRGLLLLRLPAHVPSRGVRATTHNGRAQQWTSPCKHDCLLPFRWTG